MDSGTDKTLTMAYSENETGRVPVVVSNHGGSSPDIRIGGQLSTSSWPWEVDEDEEEDDDE
jgi:hypothetical protein